MQDDQGARGRVPGQHRQPNHGIALGTKKRSQKQKLKTFASKVPAFEANGPSGGDVALIPTASDPMLNTGDGYMGTDLEVGRQDKKDQQKIPRIYDVDESMNLQRMTRKAHINKDNNETNAKMQEY